MDSGFPLSALRLPRRGASLFSRGLGRVYSGSALYVIRLLDAGVLVWVPEISDYEVRREFLRSGRTESVARLDRLAEQVGYLPLTTEAMRLAARFWADARNQGQPAASDESLDADVILASQAKLAEEDGENSVVVATTNPRHLSRFVDARTWQEIHA